MNQARPQPAQQSHQNTHQNGPQKNGNGGGSRVAPAPQKLEDNAALLDAILSKEHKFIPLGESEAITLTPWLVMEFLAVPTKKGIKPNIQDCVKFTIMCRQRQLNPFAGDAYMVGYDTQDGPKFSVITSIQAMLSRAEINPKFKGIESGVIVQYKDGDLWKFEERQGDLVYDAEVLLGGWCKVYREDRDMPNYQRLKLSSYNKGTPQWRQDAAGMICKCAESAALRQAFPSVNGGLFLKDEIEAFINTKPEERKPHTGAGGPVTLEVLGGNPATGAGATAGAAVATAVATEHADDPFGNPQSEASESESANDQQIEPASDESQLPAQQFDEPQDEMLGWQVDIQRAATNGELDNLADQASKAHAGIKTQLLKMIADRRIAIRKK